MQRREGEKMNKLLGIGVVLFIVAVAQAGIVLNEEFDQSVGSTLTSMGWSTSAVNVVDTDFSAAVTDGTTGLVVSGVNGVGAMLKQIDGGTTYTTGSIKLTTVLKDWSYSGSNGLGLFLGFGDSTDGDFAVAGLQLANSGTTIKAGFDNNFAGVNKYTSGTSANGALPLMTLVLDVDLDNNLYNYTWTGTNGDGSSGSLAFAPVDFTIDSIAIGLRGTGTMAGSATIDSMIVETIPEPATLGMVGVFGAALLFVRRKFMV
jgi:hypothetical protein